MKDKTYPLLTFLSLVIIGIGTTFYHFWENFTWVDAFYFSVVTLATVGYGDITPKTDVGKLFTVFYIVIGVGIIATFINTLVKRAGERRQKRLEKQNHEN